MPAAISTHGLTKYYGKTPGIVDLDLTVNTGEVFGFLGPNGAGKSTTIRVLLDFLHPSRGRAAILGLDSHRDSVEIRRRVGYLPADLALYPQMTARELFGYFCAVRHVDAGKRIRVLAERFAQLVVLAVAGAVTDEGGPFQALLARRSFVTRLDRSGAVAE